MATSKADIAVDVGNSRIKVGVFRGRRIVETVSFPKEEVHACRLPELAVGSVGRIGIASVVPELTAHLTTLFRGRYGVRPLVIRPGDCGIVLRVRNPGTIGVDRVLNARAASHRHPGRAIVVDVGTAVTVDVVDAARVFAGGAILPGPDLWLESLGRAAQLPTEHFAGKARLTGRDTVEALQAGAVFGLAGAIDGIVGRLLAEDSGRRVFLTGGWSGAFADVLENRFLRVEHLCLEGINLVLGDS